MTPSPAAIGAPSEATKDIVVLVPGVANGVPDKPVADQWKDVDYVPDVVHGGFVERPRETFEDKYKDHAFIIKHVFKMERAGNIVEKITVVLYSPDLKRLVEDIMDGAYNLSWRPTGIELEPQVLLAWLPRFESKLTAMRAVDNAEVDTTAAKHLTLLIEFLRVRYAKELKEVESSLAAGVITYDLLWTVFVPNTILYTTCPVSSRPRAVQLLSTAQDSYGNWHLVCRYIDSLSTPSDTGNRFGYAKITLRQTPFQGEIKLTSLVACPMEHRADQKEVQAKLIDRGRHWRELVGLHHMHYTGVAWSGSPAESESDSYAEKDMWEHKRVNVNSRIMVDKATFRRLNPKYPIPRIEGLEPAENESDSDDDVTDDNLDPNPDTNAVWPGQNDGWGGPPPPGQNDSWGGPPLPGQNDSWGAPLPVPQHSRTQRKASTINNAAPNGAQAESGKETLAKSKIWTTFADLDDNILLLATPIVYGFSLTDKIWVTFNVENIAEIKWNDDAFSNLVLPPAHKRLVQSLVQAHADKLCVFDDFIEGKGQGLVFNLFGPPGIGKTMTAEATSEHLRRPLYIVDASELGEGASGLDRTLGSVFDLAETWSAIVLIDEADVYLEKRALHDDKRNAAVAVFLRRLEYLRGILFLTTNRCSTFDPAFMSRIHVSLRFKDLDENTKLVIWKSFLGRIGLVETDLTKEEWTKLAVRKVNGRQIKNCVRTAQALAASLKEKLSFSHLDDVLSIVEDFETSMIADGN